MVGNVFKSMQSVSQEFHPKLLTLDQSIFAHPVAKNTEWSPLSKSFHSIKTIQFYKEVIKITPTVHSLLLLTFFIWTSLFIGQVTWQQFHEPSVIKALALFMGNIISVSTTVLLAKIIFSPKIFDLKRRVFLSGIVTLFKSPSELSMKEQCPFQKIAAVQLLSVIGPKKREYFELNLVLFNGERIHIHLTNNHDSAVKGATNIAAAMYVPLWNAI